MTHNTLTTLCDKQYYLLVNSNRRYAGRSRTLNTNLYLMLKDMKHWSRTSTVDCSDCPLWSGYVKIRATREDRRPDRCHVTDTEQPCQQLEMK